jgi:hypothetical protein
MVKFLGSDTDTLSLAGGDAKIYLAQSEGDLIGPSSGFNYTEAQKEAERLAREAELGWYEAQAACDDPEAARKASDKARAAADAVGAIDQEATVSTWPNWDPSLPTKQQKPGYDEPESDEAPNALNEIQNDADSARYYARRADAVADAIERGKECEPPFLTSDLKLPPILGQTDSLKASASLAPFDVLADTSMDMRSPLSADNSRFLKAYTEIASIEESRGRAPDAASERLAAAATVQSKVDGLDSIGRVVMNVDATHAFVTNTEDPSAPWAKRSTVDVTAAVATPVEASNAKLDQVNTLLASRDQGAARVEPHEIYRAGPNLA